MVYRAIETWPWCEMMKSMSFLPLRILVNVDAVLITLTIFDKLRTRYIKRGTKGPRVNKKALLARGAGRFHGNAYQELEGNNGFDGNDHQMESRIVSMPRRPTGFEQLGTSEAAFLFQDQLKQDDGSQKTDLHHFVESLSKCRYATKVGLSVEFQDLASKPPKLNRKILSEDSGTINGGSLWGVVGASRAGKCKLSVVHITRIETDIRKLLCECPNGKAIQYWRCYKNQWCSMGVLSSTVQTHPPNQRVKLQLTYRLDTKISWLRSPGRYCSFRAHCSRRYPAFGSYTTALHLVRQRDSRSCRYSGQLSPAGPRPRFSGRKHCSVSHLWRTENESVLEWSLLQHLWLCSFTSQHPG